MVRCAPAREIVGTNFPESLASVAADSRSDGSGRTRQQQVSQRGAGDQQDEPDRTDQRRRRLAPGPDLAERSGRPPKIRFYQVFCRCRLPQRAELPRRRLRSRTPMVSDPQLRSSEIRLSPGSEVFAGYAHRPGVRGVALTAYRETVPTVQSTSDAWSARRFLPC